MDKERHEGVVADEETGAKARRGRRVAARSGEGATDTTIVRDGACRLHFATRTVDGAGAPLRTNPEGSNSRHILHRLAEALPRALDQAAGSSTAEHRSK